MDLSLHIRIGGWEAFEQEETLISQRKWEPLKKEGKRASLIAFSIFATFPMVALRVLQIQT